MEQAREQYARSLQISWVTNGQAPETHPFISELQTALQPFKGGNCPVGISYTSSVASTSLQLGDNWRVHPTDELLNRLKKLSCVTDVDVKYR
jgi:DNA polymerase-3 subunit alpha